MMVEPREVVVDWRPHLDNHESPFERPFIAAVPLVLQICKESRAAVERSYQRIFRDPAWSHQSEYALVNFALDSIRIHQTAIPLVARHSKHTLIRHLTVECTDAAAFYGLVDIYGHGQYIITLQNLQSLKIVAMGLAENSMDYLTSSYQAFCMIMASYYWTCKPVHFETRIFNSVLPTMYVHKGNIHKIWLRLCKYFAQNSDIHEIAACISLTNMKESPLWIHADCPCEAPVTREIDFHFFRWTPHWDTREQKLR